MPFLNPLDTLIPKIPFSFFADFWVWVTSEARWSVSVGFWGSCQLRPFWGKGGLAGGLYRPLPHSIASPVALSLHRAEMYPDRVHHAVHDREVEKWGKMGKDGARWGKMEEENGARWRKMGKLGGGKRGLNFPLLFCVAHSFLLHPRTSSKLVGDGHGYCFVPSPLLATMGHLVTHKGIKYIPVKVITDPQRK